MADRPAVVELMLRLDLPPRLCAQALGTLERCGDLPTFAANSLLQALIPARDQHFACPVRRVPPSIFTRRAVRADEARADLAPAGATTTARQHPLAVVLPVVCSFLTDAEAMRLADTCSWMRRSVLCGQHPLRQSARALWTCPPELPTWRPATLAGAGVAAARGPDGDATPAHLEPSAVLRGLPPLQRRVALGWLARTRACPFCAVAACHQRAPGGERMTVPGPDVGRAQAGERSSPASCDDRLARSDSGRAADGAASSGKQAASGEGAAGARARSPESAAPAFPRRAVAMCHSLRPALFGFASAGVVAAVRDGRAVFGADYLPDTPWHWHCAGCFRQFLRVPVPRHWRASHSADATEWQDATDLAVGARLDASGEFVAAS